MILILSREERELVRRLRALEPYGERLELNEEILKLKRDISGLEITKSQREEEFAKQERELRHMIGLERKRQELERAQSQVDAEQAARTAALDVREEALVAERKRFEEQLAFNTERFGQMEKYLKDMLSDILQRLPNISMTVERRERDG